MVTFELKRNAKLSNSEREALEEARRKPVVYDDDSPAMTDNMERAFAMARKRKMAR